MIHCLFLNCFVLRALGGAGRAAERERAAESPGRKVVKIERKKGFGFSLGVRVEGSGSRVLGLV